MSGFVTFKRNTFLEWSPPTDILSRPYSDNYLEIYLKYISGRFYQFYQFHLAFYLTFHLAFCLSFYHSIKAYLFIILWNFSIPPDILSFYLTLTWPGLGSKSPASIARAGTCNGDLFCPPMGVTSAPQLGHWPPCWLSWPSCDPLT